jgi:hypothetical protein
MTYAIGYVVVVRSSAHLAMFTDELRALEPTPLLDAPAYSAVLVESPRRYQLTDDVWSLPDVDLQGLGGDFPGLDGRYPNVNGVAIGSRWPVIWDQSEQQDWQSNQVIVEVNYEHLILRRATRDQFLKVCAIVAHILSRYQTLVEAVAECQDLLRNVTLTENKILSEQDRSRVVELRSRISICTVLSDPTPLVYWQFEGHLMESLYEIWGMDRVERAAQHAMDSTHEILEAAASAEESVRVAQRSRQLRIVKNAVAALSVFNLISAAVELIEFTTGDSSLRADSIVRPAVSLGLLVVAALVLIVFVRYSGRLEQQDSEIERARQKVFTNILKERNL